MNENNDIRDAMMEALERQHPELRRDENDDRHKSDPTQEQGAHDMATRMTVPQEGDLVTTLTKSRAYVVSNIYAEVPGHTNRFVVVTSIGAIRVEFKAPARRPGDPQQWCEVKEHS
jgi:hypothetical protein